METQAEPLIEIRTSRADGSRGSIIVRASQARVAYRAALAAAWRAKAGDIVEALPA